VHAYTQSRIDYDNYSYMISSAYYYERLDITQKPTIFTSRVQPHVLGIIAVERGI